MVLAVAIAATMAGAQGVSASSQLTGTALIEADGSLVAVPAGVELVFEGSSDCGRATVSEAGLFGVVIGDQCDALDVFDVSLTHLAGVSGIWNVGTDLVLEVEDDVSVVLGIAHVDGSTAAAGTTVELFGSDGVSCGESEIRDEGSFVVDSTACAGESGSLQLSGDSGAGRPVAVAGLGDAAVVDVEFEPSFTRSGFARFVTEERSTRLVESLEIVFSVDSVECGIAQVLDRGKFDVELRAPCTRNGTVDVSLSGVPSVSHAGLDLSADQLQVDLVAGEVGVLLMGQVHRRQEVLSSAQLDFVRQSGDACGSAGSNATGVYVVLLDAACQRGDEVDVSNDDFSTVITLPEAMARPVIDLTLAETTSGTIEPPSIQIDDRPERVLEEQALVGILLALIGTAALVVLSLVIGRHMLFKRRAAMIVGVRSSSSGDAVDALCERMIGCTDDIDFRMSRTMLEASIISAVTIGLVVLLLSGSMSERGAIPLFGAILGYAAGRSSS